MIKGIYEKVNLFCLPFAGGNKYSYRLYEQLAPSFVNVISLEYPGRGARVSEPLIYDISLLTRDIYSQIKNEIEKGNYVLYGHSMGGLVAYLITKKIAKDGLTLPQHLFITGTSGPSAVLSDRKKRYLLSKPEFVQEIIDIGGSPENMLANNELLDFYEPILRADFTASETYIHEPNEPMDVPITVITGSGEAMKKEDIYLWQKESKFKVDFKVLPGNHFFIYKQSTFIMKTIVNRILETHK